MYTRSNKKKGKNSEAINSGEYVWDKAVLQYESLRGENVNLL